MPVHVAGDSHHCLRIMTKVLFTAYLLLMIIKSSLLRTLDKVTFIAHLLLMITSFLLITVAKGTIFVCDGPVPFTLPLDIASAASQSCRLSAG